MNQTLFYTELSLHYPPWLGVLKTLPCGLLDVKNQNQQTKKRSVKDGHRSTDFVIGPTAAWWLRIRRGGKASFILFHRIEINDCGILQYLRRVNIKARLVPIVGIRGRTCHFL